MKSFIIRDHVEGGMRWTGHVVRNEAIFHMHFYFGNLSGRNHVGRPRCMWECNIKMDLNPLNTKLNLICHLLALLGAHHILHISRIRVKATGCEDVEWIHMAQ